MNIELLIPVVFFAVVAVIMPAIVLAGLVVFAAREAVERRAARGAVPGSQFNVHGSEDGSRRLKRREQRVRHSNPEIKVEHPEAERTPC